LIMADVKYDTKYYVKLPGHELYVKESDALHLEFACFFDNANSFTKEKAIELAKGYSLEVAEHTVTTTTDIKTKIVYKGEIK